MKDEPYMPRERSTAAGSPEAALPRAAVSAPLIGSMAGRCVPSPDVPQECLAQMSQPKLQPNSYQ
eukprot:CAMPEP_0172711380 /NCGR_PEP_ID=MMETSP1074-20121228/58877_1 /TAXON_ID=2916 /ORGANISM="Ceratium fusus, Strain PA161109" /LENGTH=64 /DNA_ID=CAMNT_0013535027 /DNA_START=475 /DNA_END=666 /DNA_ORIENTATION=-